MSKSTLKADAVRAIKQRTDEARFLTIVNQVHKNLVMLRDDPGFWIIEMQERTSGVFRVNNIDGFRTWFHVRVPRTRGEAYTVSSEPVPYAAVDGYVRRWYPDDAPPPDNVLPPETTVAKVAQGIREEVWQQYKTFVHESQRARWQRNENGTPRTKTTT